MKRQVLLTTTALAAVFLSACSGGSAKGVDISTVSAHLIIDPATGLPALKTAQATCVAGVLKTYVKPGELAGYVAGKRTFADLDTDNEAATQAGVDTCLSPSASAAGEATGSSGN